jgi:type II secretory pathway component PulJ
MSRSHPVGGAFPGPGAVHGFTLVELLAAGAVFSLVALAMGLFLLFTVERTAEGEARAELQRNASLLAHALRRALEGAQEIRVPALGEAGGEDSFTAIFPSEPFLDENRNGQWDSSGAGGPCAPQECFEDLNRNGLWDASTSPPLSFRLRGGALEVREGEGQWKEFLENRYGSLGGSSVQVEEFRISHPDSSDAGLWLIRALIRDDRGSAGDPTDDLRRAVEILVRQRS